MGGGGLVVGGGWFLLASSFHLFCAFLIRRNVIRCEILEQIYCLIFDLLGLALHRGHTHMGHCAMLSEIVTLL